MEQRSAALLYRVACDLEAELKQHLPRPDSDAIKALQLWREMDAALLEYSDLRRRVLRIAQLSDAAAAGKQQPQVCFGEHDRARVDVRTATLGGHTGKIDDAVRKPLHFKV